MSSTTGVQKPAKAVPTKSQKEMLEAKLDRLKRIISDYCRNSNYVSWADESDGVSTFTFVNKNFNVIISLEDKEDEHEGYPVITNVEEFFDWCEERAKEYRIYVRDHGTDKEKKNLGFI